MVVSTVLTHNVAGGRRCVIVSTVLALVRVLRHQQLMGLRALIVDDVSLLLHDSRHLATFAALAEQLQHCSEWH